MHHFLIGEFTGGLLHSRKGVEMKVVWWVSKQKDKGGHERARESEHHAVDFFSSSHTYCGCTVPSDFADVVGEISQNITCKKCLGVAKRGFSD